MSLYTKHRPKSLEKMVGNENTVNALTVFLSKKNHNRVILLSGQSGCGKTTLARIIATMVNCVGMDFVEINSSDDRGIDLVRDLKKNSLYPPIAGENKVFMLDECHKLTNDAQNAILKLLEDTPPNTYFILSTTEPEKLIPTVKNRCTSFIVETLDHEKIFTLLKRIVKREKEQVDDDILDLISSESSGSPRMAINMLETVLSTPVEDRKNIVHQKAAENNQSMDLCRAIFQKNPQWKDVSKILEGLKKVDPESVRRAVLGTLQLFYCAVGVLLLQQCWNVLKSPYTIPGFLG